MSAQRLRNVFATAARAAAPQSPLAPGIELCLKQSEGFPPDKYGKHCTLRCLCLTFLKAQLDFMGWKGRGRAIAARAAVAQITKGVFLFCSKANIILLFI